MKKLILNTYMENSKKYVLLNLILGVMEILNAPVKLGFMIIPIGIYVISLRFKEYLALPFIPERIKHEYDILINVLLLILFVLSIMVVIVTLGRSLHDRENMVIREAFEGKKENKTIIHLIYKRKKGDMIERRIYSHTILDEWNDKSVSIKILKIFDEHFEEEKFITDIHNSRVTIMKTKKGFTKPIKEKYHDEKLDKEMGEII